MGVFMCISVFTIPGMAKAQSQLIGGLVEHTQTATESARLLLTGNPPSLGYLQAPVTVIEFADFECSYCKQMSDLLEKELLPAETNKVRIVYRYLPLPQHPWARAAVIRAQER